MGLSIGGHTGCSCGTCRPVPLRTTAPGESLAATSHRPGETASKENAKPASTTASTVQPPAAADRYTPADKKLIEELKARDREVRAHETAHKSAAGSLARGSPSYSFQRGPDGVSYAIGGEVQIDLSPVPGNPEATLRKAQQIRAAALAPAQPSAQDYAVAAEAARMAAEAQRQTGPSAASGEPNSSSSTRTSNTDSRDEAKPRSTSTAAPDNRISAYQHTQQDPRFDGQRLSEVA